MNALFAKDLRLNMPATIAWFIVYLTMPIALILTELTGFRFNVPLGSTVIGEAATNGIVAALVIASVIVPAFGANAFARERRERSADYLASFPVPRGNVVASKLVVTLGLCLLPWVGAAIMLAVANMLWPTTVLLRSRVFDDSAYQFIRGTSCVQVFMLGISWLLSSLLRSEFIAGATTILATIVMGVAWGVWIDRISERGPLVEHAAIQASVIAAFGLGIAGLVAGTMIALRRVSP